EPNGKSASRNQKSDYTKSCRANGLAAPAKTQSHTDWPYNHPNAPAGECPVHHIPALTLSAFHPDIHDPGSPNFVAKPKHPAGFRGVWPQNNHHSDSPGGVPVQP